MREPLRDAIANALGAEVRSARAVGGGDINDAYAVALADGRELFVKTHAAAAPEMFPAEARGLAWLAEPDVIRVPEVRAVSSATAGGPAFLALELIRPAPRVRDFDARLGRALAALHASGAPGFGLDHDNFLATLTQDNDRCDSWAEFYATRRLEPLLRRAVDTGRGPASLARAFEPLWGRLPDLAGPAEPPARLHGDLWSGNVHTDERGQPCLIDPAVYGGHREIDLAMLRLFGSPGAALFDAYDEVYPLAPGAGDRVALYQLYPLLAHVNLFGGGYVSSLLSALRRCL